MRRTWFTTGDWNAICDVCGFKFKASDLTDRWDGLKVCAKDWETRHPQDMVRQLPTEKAPPWTRPEGTDTYVGGTCTVNGRSAVPGYAVPKCSIPGNKNIITVVTN